MTTYTISTKEQRAAFTVDAETPEAAAQKAARKLNPGQRHLVAERTTGTARLSGWFQGYYSDRKVNGLNSTGPAFHVV